MNNGNLGLDRGGRGGAFWYTSAIVFLMLVPGTGLLLFGGGKTLILPKALIEFVFPISIFSPEKLFLTVVTGTFKGFGEVALADFDRVDVFVQQFFVLALLSSILIWAILTVQACAGFLYPIPDNNTPFGFVKVTAIFFLLRQILICLLVGTPTPYDSRAEVIGHLLRIIAPEFLIMMTCAMAGVIWTAALLALRAASSPLG